MVRKQIMQLHQLNILGQSQTLIPELERYKSIIWIGALSFEERCVASLQELVKTNVKIGKGILLEYDTMVFPKKDEVQKKEVNRKILLGLAKELFINVLY